MEGHHPETESTERIEFWSRASRRLMNGAEEVDLAALPAIFPKALPKEELDDRGSGKCRTHKGLNAARIAMPRNEWFRRAL